MNFYELIKTRYSSRQYKSVAVEREKLEIVLEAARLAPSAVNYQPIQILVVRDPKMLEKLAECYPRDWFKTAPACFVVCGNHSQGWHRSADNKDFTAVDTAIAIDHMTLMATEIGLGTCWVCNFDEAKLKLLFGLDENLEPIALVPIGYPAEPDANMVKDKKRKSIINMVQWDEID